MKFNSIGTPKDRLVVINHPNFKPTLRQLEGGLTHSDSKVRKAYARHAEAFRASAKHTPEKLGRHYLRLARTHLIRAEDSHRQMRALAKMKRTYARGMDKPFYMRQFRANKAHKETNMRMAKGYLDHGVKHLSDGPSNSAYQSLLKRHSALQISPRMQLFS